MSPKVLLVAVGLCCAGWGCNDTAAPLPAPPDWSTLPEQAAEAVRRQHDTFLEDPDDAAATGRLAMHLHAYEQWQAAERFYAHAEQKSSKAAAWPYLRAYVLQQRGETEAAKAAYYSALSADPSYVPARLRLAALLLDAGEQTEAEELYRGVLELQPASATAEYGLGVMAAERGDDATAIVRFERALSIAPEYSSARYALAQAYRRQGEQERAERETAVLESSPRVAEVLFDPLLFEVQGLLAGSAPEHMRRGKELADRGMHQEAIAEYDQALIADPEYAEAHINLMTSYGALGRYDRSERHYEKAAALGSDAAELHYNLGVLRSFQERFEAAVPAFRKALERDPALADAHSNLGYALEQLGRPAEAARHYLAALEQQPNHRLARFHLGVQLLAAARPADALTYLEPAIVPLDGTSPRILFAAAEAQMRLGRPAAARQLLEQALELARRHDQRDLIQPLEASLQGLPQ